MSSLLRSLTGGGASSGGRHLYGRALPHHPPSGSDKCYNKTMIMIPYFSVQSFPPSPESNCFSSPRQDPETKCPAYTAQTAQEASEASQHTGAIQAELRRLEANRLQRGQCQEQAQGRDRHHRLSYRLRP